MLTGRAARCFTSGIGSGTGSGTDAGTGTGIGTGAKCQYDGHSVRQDAFRLCMERGGGMEIPPDVAVMGFDADTQPPE